MWVLTSGTVKTSAITSGLQLIKYIHVTIGTPLLTTGLSHLRLIHKEEYMYIVAKPYFLYQFQKSNQDGSKEIINLVYQMSQLTINRTLCIHMHTIADDWCIF